MRTLRRRVPHARTLLRCAPSHCRQRFQQNGVVSFSSDWYPGTLAAPMGHGHEFCGCFPTGKSYPGIAELLLRVPPPPVGLAIEFDGEMAFADIPLAVLDTETTGKDPLRGDRIVEIAIVHYDQGKVTHRYEQLVDPGIPISAEVSAVHGITDAAVKGKPKFDAITKDVIEQLKGRIPVAYNAGFDRTFLFSEMRRAGIVPSADKNLVPTLRTTVEWLDPLVWAREVQPGERSYKLGEVANRLNVALEKAHRATDDAEAAGNVFFALMAQVKGATTYRQVISKQRDLQTNFDKTRGAWRK